MKRIGLILVICAGLFACAGASANINKEAQWSALIGQPVVKVGEIYPSGDAPRNLIELKSGEKRIY